MKIDLNKDFEEQYKNELWKGFTARELGYGVVALLVAGGIAFSVWKATGLAINLCSGNNHFNAHRDYSFPDVFDSCDSRRWRKNRTDRFAGRK